MRRSRRGGLSRPLWCIRNMTTIDLGPWAIFLRSQINHQIERGCHNWWWKGWRRLTAPSGTSHSHVAEKIRRLNHEIVSYIVLITKGRNSWQSRATITQEWDKERTIQRAPAAITPSSRKIQYLMLKKRSAKRARMNTTEEIYSHNVKRSKTTIMSQGWARISSTDSRASIYRM